MAEALGLGEAEVIERLAAMQARGVVRRIAAAPNHYALGVTANGMTVWDLDDARASELGARVGALDFVSHAYLRPRVPPAWPYNLFAMVHGRDRAEVEDEARRDRGAARAGGPRPRRALLHPHPEEDRPAPGRGRRLMFRLSQYMHELLAPEPAAPRRRRPGPVKPVVIWNLTRRCNLRCRHCYTSSADVAFPGELTHEQAMAVLDDLAAFRVPALILSGGEPLSRFDFFTLAPRAREACRYLALSTNGTAVDGEAADRIAGIGFDYVGISLDGIGATNDWFRGRDGAFAEALAGIRACVARGIKVGLRFTMTRDNEAELPRILALCAEEGIDKFYLSHLVYAGRGDKHRGEDADRARSRAAIDAPGRAGACVGAGRGAFRDRDRQQRRRRGLVPALGRGAVPARPRRAPARRLGGLGRQFLRRRRRQHRPSGAGASGHLLVRLHRRQRQGAPVLRDLDRATTRCSPALRQRPRPLKGRCGACAYKAVCGGNTRIRALQLTGDPWAEDPACFLDDAEIGVAAAPRLEVAPFRGKSHDPAHRFA